MKAFGGDDATPGKRASTADLVAAYEDKLAIYNQMLEDAINAGTIPANTTLATSRVANAERATKLPVMIRGRQF